MEAFLSKVSEYNLFNYLLPGAVFVYLMDMFGDAHLLHENVLINIFMLYFVGMVMSRVGSLVIEPILLKIKFIAVFTVASIILIYESLCEHILNKGAGVWVCIVMLILFLIAFRKQTNFIRGRVEIAIK